jgi:hypothetical protein
MVYAYNASAGEVKAGRSGVRGQSGLIKEFQVSLGYIVRPFLKKLLYWAALAR